MGEGQWGGRPALISWPCIWFLSAGSPLGTNAHYRPCVHGLDKLQSASRAPPLAQALAHRRIIPAWQPARWHSLHNGGRCVWTLPAYLSTAISRPIPPSRSHWLLRLFPASGELVEEGCSSDLLDVPSPPTPRSNSADLEVLSPGGP